MKQCAASDDLSVLGPPRNAAAPAAGPAAAPASGLLNPRAAPAYGSLGVPGPNRGGCSCWRVPLVVAGYRQRLVVAGCRRRLVVAGCRQRLVVAGCRRRLVVCWLWGGRVGEIYDKIFYCSAVGELSQVPEDNTGRMGSECSKGGSLYLTARRSYDSTETASLITNRRRFL